MKTMLVAARQAMTGCALGCVALGVLAGCPPTEQKASPSPSSSASSQAACSKVGQTCEVTAGKLGTCVQKDECSDPAGCFVCQSQH